MAQKSFFGKLLEFIGLVDTAEAQPQNAERPRYTEAPYDAPRYTPRPPRPAQTPAETAPRGNGANRYTASPRRERTEDIRPRASASDGDSGAQDTSLARVNHSLKANPGTVVFYLHSLSECGDVIADLISGSSVLLNLEETDAVLMQRIVDTLAGAAFALHAKIRKVSEKMYLIAPENVEVNMTRSVERRY